MSHPLLCALRAAVLMIAMVAGTLVAEAQGRPRSFAIRVEGQRPAMILIPGFVSSGAVWDDVVAYYKSRYTWVCVDRSPMRLVQWTVTLPRMTMCRNIKTLANFAPPATDQEIRASALQFVRKLSGTTKPSRANEAAFNRAVEEVSEAADRLIRALVTSSPPRNREEESRKAQERSRQRFAST